MATYKYKVILSEEQRNQLTEIARTGTHTAREITHALILLDVDHGPFHDKIQTHADVCKALNVSPRTIDRVKKRFFEQGLDPALKRKPTARVYKHLVDGQVEAHLIALACGDPPPGYARWSMRLLADKAVELQIVDHISYQTVHQALKKK